jgi:hypothetical protein
MFGHNSLHRDDKNEDGCIDIGGGAYEEALLNRPDSPNARHSPAPDRLAIPCRQPFCRRSCAKGDH